MSIRSHGKWLVAEGVLGIIGFIYHVIIIGMLVVSGSLLIEFGDVGEIITGGTAGPLAIPMIISGAIMWIIAIFGSITLLNDLVLSISAISYVNKVDSLMTQTHPLTKTKK